MMPLINVSTGRLGQHASCEVCGAGKLLSFNWQYAATGPDPRHRRDASVFVEPAPLRYGALYECRSCGQPWYLCGDPPFMHAVPPDRLELIRRWNEHEIVLSPEQAAQLRAIGRTPPDIYGNRSEFHETPCSVTTVQGETLDLSVISLQRHAPFEDWRACRLATDIAKIRPSPNALPLPIRVATSQAQERRMGFAPTLIELPGGESMVVNGTQHFLVHGGCRASDVALSSKPVDMDALPPIYKGTAGVTYFVADGALGI